MAQAGWKQYPHYADVRLERPIFVTGLPRTGTTALHRLLTADPSHQGLQMWLAEYPQPRPPRDTWDSNPIYRQIDAQFEAHHVEHPEFMGLHYMTAGEVEECWQLLRQSLHSVVVRNPGPHPELRSVARQAGLDADVSPVSQEPPTDRAQ